MRSTSSNADAAPNRSAAACARSRWRAHVATSRRSTTGRLGKIALTAWTPTPTAPIRITGSAVRFSQCLVRALDGGRPALPRERLREAAAAARVDRIVLDAELAPEPREQRPHVGLERVDEDAMCAENVAFGLRGRQAGLVDQQRLRVSRLDVHRRLHHRVDLPLDVVRLVDHERDAPSCAGARYLAHDPEQLEGVDRADDQVVVRVLAVVEVEAAEQALGEQQSDDLLDVRPLRMVPGVDEHLRLLAQAAAGERGRSPVRQIRAVEAGLEELVLDEQPHARAQGGVDLLEPGEEPLMARAQVVLAGVVRSAREPEADERRPDLLRDGDALAAVLDGLRAHARVGVAKAAQPELVGAEEVRI